MHLLTSRIKDLSLYLLSVYISSSLTCIFMALSIFMLFIILIDKHIYLFYFMYLFLERGKEGERHQCVVVSCVPQTGHLASLGIKPVTLHSQACAQSTELYQPGPQIDIFYLIAGIFPWFVSCFIILIIFFITYNLKFL